MMYTKHIYISEDRYENYCKEMSILISIRDYLLVFLCECNTICSILNTVYECTMPYIVCVAIHGIHVRYTMYIVQCTMYNVQ